MTLGTYYVVVNFNTLANGNLNVWFKIRVYRETGGMPRGSRKRVIMQGERKQDILIRGNGSCDKVYFGAA